MADSQDAPNVEISQNVPENTISNGAERASGEQNASDLENTIENGADKEGTFEGEPENDGRDGERDKKPFYLRIREADDAANFFCKLLADSPLLTIGNIEPLFQRLSAPVRFARDMYAARKEYKKELREHDHQRRMDAAEKFKNNDPSDNQVISDKDGIKVTEIGNTGTMKFGKDGRGKISTLEKMYAVERTGADGKTTTEFLNKKEVEKQLGIKVPPVRATDAEKQEYKDRYSLTDRQARRLNKRYKDTDANLARKRAEKDKAKEERPQQAEKNKEPASKNNKKEEKAKDQKSKDEKKKAPKKRASKEQNPEMKKLIREQKRIEKQITEAEKKTPNFDKTPEGKKLYNKLFLNDVKQQQVAVEDKITKAEKQNPNYDKTKEGKADYKKLFDLEKQANTLNRPPKESKSKGLSLQSAPKQISNKKASSKKATSKARNIKTKEDANNRSVKSLQNSASRLKSVAKQTNRSASKQRTSTRTSGRTPFTGGRNANTGR